MTQLVVTKLVVKQLVVKQLVVKQLVVTELVQPLPDPAFGPIEKPRRRSCRASFEVTRTARRARGLRKILRPEGSMSLSVSFAADVPPVCRRCAAGVLPVCYQCATSVPPLSTTDRFGNLQAVFDSQATRVRADRFGGELFQVERTHFSVERQFAIGNLNPNTRQLTQSGLLERLAGVQESLTGHTEPDGIAGHAVGLVDAAIQGFVATRIDGRVPVGVRERLRRRGDWKQHRKSRFQKEGGG